MTLGLILTSVLLPAADAFAGYPACNATPPYCTPSACNTSCTCCGSSNQIFKIPASDCTTGNTVYTLPGAIGNTLPANNVPNLITVNGSCPSGQTCLTDGTCGTCTWSTCSGCTATCNSSCTGTQSDGCGNTQSCTIPALSDGASCTTTDGAAGTCSGGVCTATCTSSTTNGVQCSGGSLYYNDSCGNVDTTNLYSDCSAVGQGQGCVNGHTKCITTYSDSGGGIAGQTDFTCYGLGTLCLNSAQGDPGGINSEGATMNANGFCIKYGYYDARS